MKSKHFLCFLLLLGLPWLGACKKDDDVAAPDITGAWVGQYGFGTKATGSGYKFFIDEGGEFGVNIDTTSAVPTAKGTWNLSGKTFRATCTYTSGEIYSVKGTLNNTILEGTWGKGSQRDGQGLFTIKKK